jgi:secretion/DNA translocation related CpaE-like protein
MDRAHVDHRAAAAAQSQPLVLSLDPDNVHELTGLCAAAAVTADVQQPTGAASRWARASCVLVGEECAADVAALGLRRRDDVVLVGRGAPTSSIWQRAVQIGASAVVHLPGDASRVADVLARVSATSRSPGMVVGVVGAGGGAGASTVAASMATAHARRHERSLVVDADALGGGIELLMGCEAVPGLRWPDIEVGEGRVAPSALLAALPSIDGVSVLSASRTHRSAIDASVVRTMLRGGRRACSLVVVDLPRRVDWWSDTVSPDVDVTLVVVTTEIRSAAAGRHLVDAARDSCSDLRVVVRTTAGRRLEPDDVAETIGLPLAGVVPTRRSVARAADDGTGALQGRGAVRRYAALLDRLRPLAGSR